AYEAAGDVVAALRVALDAGREDAVERLVSQAITSGQADALLAALERGNRPAEEARVRLALGDAAAAADAFERAGRFDEAAACAEDLGDARRAGLLLERHLEAHPDDAAAGLRLGRVLARFG